MCSCLRVDNCRKDQRVARYGSFFSSAQGIQYTTVPFLRYNSSLNCFSRPEWASNVRRQMAAKGSLASLSRWHRTSHCSSMGKGTSNLSWKAIFLRKVLQLLSSYPSYRFSRMGQLFAKRATRSAIVYPTVKASVPLYASRMARMRFRLNSKVSSLSLHCKARIRNCTPASLTSLPMNARKKGKRRVMFPSITKPVLGTVFAQMACAVLRKQSAYYLVRTEMPSSRIMLKSFFFSSASCQRAEVSWARVLRLALSGVEGTLPLRQIHCPRNRGSSRALVPSAFISSSKSASGEAQVRSTRRICSFLYSYCIPCVTNIISPCRFSRAACTTSSGSMASLRSRCINLMAPSMSNLVSNSTSVWSRAQCSCPMRESAACDFTMWSIKLGFVNNVIQQAATTFSSII